MNKKIAEYFSMKGFKIEGNKGLGKLGNYNVNLLVNIYNNMTPVLLYFTCYIDEDLMVELKTQLDKAEIKFANYTIDDYGLIVGLNDITINKLLQRMDIIIDTITSILDNNNVKGIGYCAKCGIEVDENTGFYQVGEIKVVLDENCVSNINAIITKENDDFNDAPNNYLKGFLGALIGGLVGGIIFVVLFLLGYISALSALVGVVLGALLYRKFGGKQNKMMILIVVLTTFVCLIFALFAMYISYAAGLCIENNINLTGLEAFQLLMEDADFKREFISNLVMTIIFTCIGAGVEIFNLSRKIKRTGKIENK